jgi:perosamine synthetase
MWSRLRLDIRWPELARGLLDSLLPVQRESCRNELESTWAGAADDTMACLCVRSGFDLLLQALDLPKGSEVLFSALTIADMPRVAEANGLVPVPVDVGRDFHINADLISQAVSEKSRVLVIAHVFGARPDLSAVLEVAREHNLFVVEDCAQAWCEPAWRGTVLADASLFSFGTIKTMTAFGGALCRVNDQALLKRMRMIEAGYPVKSRVSQFIKICKFALIKAASTKVLFGWLTGISAFFNKPVDELLRGFTRAFPPGKLVSLLRQQTDSGTLKMLKRRLQTYDIRRVQTRIAHARQIISRLDLDKSQPELLDGRHCFWLFPLVADKHQLLMAHLRKNGYDSTQRGALVVVNGPDDSAKYQCPVATVLLEKTVFLPCYFEMTGQSIEEMCDVVISLR